MMVRLSDFNNDLSLTCTIKLYVHPIVTDETKLERNNKRKLFTLPRCRRAALIEVKFIGLCCSIIFRAHFKYRCARLFVPAAELRKVATAGIFHRRYKLFDSDGFAIMAIKIQITALAESFSSQKGVIHAYDFRAFLIHGQGVKVIDLHIGIWLYLMRHWAAIFGKLMGT